MIQQNWAPVIRSDLREIGRVHRCSLAELKSPKRRKEMSGRPVGEPGGAWRLESSRHGYSAR